MVFVSNMILVVSEDNIGVIDAEEPSCHGYYIVEFSSTSYTLQKDFNIY